LAALKFMPDAFAGKSIFANHGGTQIFIDNRGPQGVRTLKGIALMAGIGLYGQQGLSGVLLRPRMRMTVTILMLARLVDELRNCDIHDLHFVTFRSHVVSSALPSRTRCMLSLVTYMTFFSPSTI
jgi:hypothetical protein